MPVAFQNLQQLLRRYVPGFDIQVQKIPGNRYPHAHTHPAANIQAGETSGALHFPQCQQCLHPFVQHPVHQFFLLAAVAFLFFLVPVGKPLLRQVHDLILPGFLPESLYGLLRRRMDVGHGKFPLTVSCRHTAYHILFLRIQIKYKSGLGRKICLNFLGVFLHNIHHALQQWEHRVVKSGQVIPSHLKAHGPVGAKLRQCPDPFHKFLVHPAEGILADIVARAHTIVKPGHSAVHADAVESPCVTHIVFPNGQGNLRIPLLRVQKNFLPFFAFFVLILKALFSHQAVKLIQSPSENGKLSVFGCRLSGIIPGLYHSSLKIQLFLHDSADIFYPLFGILRKMADIMAETGIVSVNRSLGFLYIFVKVKQILHHEQLLFPDLKRHCQITRFKRQAGNQVQTLRFPRGIRNHIVGPLLQKRMHQNCRTFIRGVPQPCIFLQALLHQCHKGCQVSTVLPPVIPGIVMPPAFHALAFRIQHGIPVENHVNRKFRSALAPCPYGFRDQVIPAVHISAVYSCQADFPLFPQLFPLLGDGFGQPHVLSHGTGAEILILRRLPVTRPSAFRLIPFCRIFLLTVQHNIFLPCRFFLCIWGFCRNHFRFFCHRFSFLHCWAISFSMALCATVRTGARLLHL